MGWPPLKEQVAAPRALPLTSEANRPSLREEVPPASNLPFGQHQDEIFT